MARPYKKDEKLVGYCIRVKPSLREKIKAIATREGVEAPVIIRAILETEVKYL